MSQWISVLLQNNNIPNFSIQECFQLFGTSLIKLNEYMLVTVGRQEEGEEEENNNNFSNKQVSFLKLLSNIEGHKPLQGIHQIQLYQSSHECSTFWVYSLSSLRHKLLHFTDYLSFERSTFLVLPTQRKLVRLKCIRSIAVLPTTKPQHMYHHPILCGPEISTSTIISRPLDPLPPKDRTITSRTQSQFKKHLEQIYTSYVRDLHTQYSKKEILCILRSNIESYMSLLEEIIN